MSDPAPITLETALAHRAFVRRLARSLLADPHAADDIEQATWQSLLERPPSGVRNVRAWLSGTVRNLVRVHARTEARRRQRESSTVPVAAGAAADTAEHLEQIERLLSALRALPEAQRVAVMLRFFDGLPPRGIAARLDVPVATVQSRLQRALAALRRDLQETWRRETGSPDGWRASIAAFAALPRPAAVAPASTSLLAIAALLVVVAAGVFWALRTATGTTDEPGVPARSVADAARGDPDLRAPLGEPSRAPVPDADSADTVPEPPAGPSFRLALLGLPHAADPAFSARLVAPDPRLQYETAFGSVVGDPPTARFSPDARGLRGGPPFALEVRSEDGYWFGTAEVSAVGGEYPLVLNVALTECGAVEGLLAQPGGAPVGQARVALRPARPGSAEREHIAATDAEGRFVLHWIPPGDYELRADSHRHAAWSQRLRVERSTTATLHGELTPLPGGLVTGTLASRAGAFHGLVHVLLTARDSDRAFTRKVELVDGAVASFAFDGVPEGTYDATVHTGTFHRWTPSSQAVEPPMRSLEFAVEDGAPARDLELRARDAVTGAAILDFAVFVRLDSVDDPATTKVRRSADGAAVLRQVPDDATIEWILRADGHAPARGDRRVFRTDAATVDLRPGWGNRIRAVDRDGTPVAGAAVWLDGMQIGRTDASGVLDVTLRRPPRELRVEKSGLRTAGGDVFEDGTFADLIWGVTVVLEPTDD